MKDPENRGSQPGLPRGMETGRVEFLLRTEIAFWRDLVANCGDAAPPESVERMRQALALAERRLLQLYRGDGDESRSIDRPPGTSDPGGRRIN